MSKGSKNQPAQNQPQTGNNSKQQNSNASNERSNTGAGKKAPASASANEKPQKNNR